MATLYHTVQLVRALAPLEHEGWIVGACGSTLRDGKGGDIDILLVREPDRHQSDLTIRLRELGITRIAPHRHRDGSESGYGWTGIWDGHPVDIGVC